MWRRGRVEVWGLCVSVEVDLSPLLSPSAGGLGRQFNGHLVGGDQSAHTHRRTPLTHKYTLSVSYAYRWISPPRLPLFSFSLSFLKKLRLLLLGHLSALFSAFLLFLICLVTKLLQKNMKGWQEQSKKMPVQCEDWARKIVKLERKGESCYGCKGWHERRARLGWWEGGRGVKMRTRVENVTWVNTFPSSLLYFSTFFTFSSHQVL